MTGKGQLRVRRNVDVRYTVLDRRPLERDDDNYQDRVYGLPSERRCQSDTRLERYQEETLTMTAMKQAEV